MNRAVFTTLAGAGFVVAFLHAAIPTHWLPFVVMARAQGWNRAKTLAITGIAGTGHVLFMTILGALIVWGGMAVNQTLGGWFPWIAGGALIAFGAIYLVRQFAGSGHGHTHLFGRHSQHGHEPRDIPRRPSAASDWSAIASLFALLTFSPCEGFLPLFLTGARYGWMGFALLSAVLAGATVGGMVTFTWLTLINMEKLRLGTLEKYEALIMGGLLCLLGLLIIIFEH